MLKDFFRNLKITSVVYNMIHYRQLLHNKAGYKRFGIKKPLFWTISSKDFKHTPFDVPWLDKADAIEQLHTNKELKKFPEETQQQLLQWPENGYLILKNCFSLKEVDSINEEMEHLLKEQKVHWRYNNRKIMFSMYASTLIRRMAIDKRITSVMEFILKMPVIAFQNINFYKGSEQKAHSDSIHMTTFPPGYLIAAWIALEDVDHTNGPLFYLPGSHKLRYLLNDQYEHGGGKLVLGSDAYDKYEIHLEEEIKRTAFTSKEFHAKKGDVLIWHANLLHGGKAILDETSTRKSMVVHFYGKNVIKYHETTQRPSLIKDFPE
ncbi:MAG: phytanoyl-CoA dioxygenase family protein [Cytophagales bacterium]|nr:phytanoyl-CoA dioxygenase family protein [Cytophaga sp.]